MESNSYLALAKRDLQNAQELFQVTSTGYNLVARLAQQGAEKIMKHFIEKLSHEDFIPLLGTHNTVRLYNAILSLGMIPENRAHRKELLLLKNYYFDTNYPGENYIEIDYETAKEALDFATMFVEMLLEAGQTLEDTGNIRKNQPSDVF